MKKAIIVGGGAAGMLAAIFLLREGVQVTIVEKNEKLGKKLYITGKGRCNLTNACATEEIFQNISSNDRFMYSAINNFTNYEMMGLMEELGVPIKIERGDRVFPVSDKSSDVISGLKNEITRLKGEILYKTEVKEIIVKDNIFIGVKLGNGKILNGDYVIIATGGMSYPSTGSDGDGYTFAKTLGHGVSRITPSLVPVNVREEYVKELMGLSLKNVSLNIFKGNKCIYEEFGEMLFTHFGVSGPIILSASSKINHEIMDNELSGYIDLKPALSIEQLDDRILRDFNTNVNKSFKNVLDGLLPKKIIPVIIKLSNINPEKKINSVTKEERLMLVNVIKHFPFTIIGLRGYDEAIITKGGINVKEINPKTMESKKVKGLFFAGEVLDVDALTGGYNLQIAWSSARAAAYGIIES